MEKEKVPQDKSNLTKNNVKELLYATDADGNYTTTLSTGWEPKTIALSNSRLLRSRNGQLDDV